MRVQVAIVGGGPAGALLSRLLHRAGIDHVVLELRTKEYVLGRIRAGVLEKGTVDLLRKAGVSARMDTDGLMHTGFRMTFNDQSLRIALDDLTGGDGVMVYGQTHVQRDLYDADAADGNHIQFEVSNIELSNVDTTSPSLTYQKDGETREINCDFVIGCDGFHGICRRTIPEDRIRKFERTYPFGWLGVLSETPPVSHELIYTSHERGFALCSMRSTQLSRYYIQCPVTDHAGDWSDAQFWDELKRRLPNEVADTLVTGKSIEKSIAVLRSYVVEPMRFGSLFLAGDAAHIVPPAGAKGLNLAASDIHYLSEGLIQFYRNDDSQGLDTYSQKALARIWKAERFSWWMTNLTHLFPDSSPFERRMQEAEFDYLANSRAAQLALAENYIGLPL